jgi:hypothetical protein
LQFKEGVMRDNVMTSNGRWDDTFLADNVLSATWMTPLATQIIYNEPDRLCLQMQHYPFFTPVISVNVTP